MHSLSTSKVLDERLDEGRTARIVLRAGRGNVIDSATIAELTALVVAVREAPEVCALLLDHEGPDFSFGASVPEHVAGRVERMLPALHTLARELVDLAVPTFACVRGRCLGGGLELVALCDRVLASPEATFAQPEVKLGVFAPIGTLALPRLVGVQNASDLLYSGRTIGAAEARAMGLVAEVVDDPTARAIEYVHRHLLEKSTTALRLAARAMRLAWSEEFARRLAQLEGLYLEESMNTNDANEGLRAFLEKRAPNWSHR